jgi:Bacterial regulatory proteins, tetR family
VRINPSQVCGRVVFPYHIIATISSTMRLVAGRRWPGPKNRSGSKAIETGMQRGVKQALPEPGPGKGAQTSRGVKRRDLILKVAARLFAKNGFDSVPINEIGIAAGITGPAIYRYFASKETLLVSVYNHLYQRYSNGITLILAEEISAWKSLEMLVDCRSRSQSRSQRGFESSTAGNATSPSTKQLTSTPRIADNSASGWISSVKHGQT